MKSFKQFILEDSDYFLTENEALPEFDKVEHGATAIYPARTSYSNHQYVDDIPVTFTATKRAKTDQQGNLTHEHELSYDINHSMTRDSKIEDIHPATRMNILKHVGKIAHGYILKHVLPEGGNHEVVASGLDDNEATEKAKSDVYRKFFPRLATATGAKVENRGETTVLKYSNQ